MTPIEFKEKMQEISEGGCTEIKHSFADDLMCNILIELGYIEGVNIFREMDKWYA